MGSIYSMQKRADGWVISVGSDELLTCSRRATAICVIQQAAHGLELPDEALTPLADEPDDHIEETPRIRRIA